MADQEDGHGLAGDGACGPRSSPSSAWFTGDPLPWLLAEGDPSARWLTLTGVLGRPGDDADVLRARAEVVADPRTRALVDRLPDWEGGVQVSGHDSPGFAPNLLALLADMGVTGGDFPRVDVVLDAMLAHQDPDGRFQSYGAVRRGETPRWGALLCDTHAIVDVLVRYGHGQDPRVRAGLDRMLADLTDTAQGRAWPCRPDRVGGFRGPGRRGDCCPQVTVEALRAWGRLPADQRPAAAATALDAAARTLIGIWRGRGTHRPYQFGHGRTFKTVKWPPTWYRVDAVLDPFASYPQLWRGPTAGPQDRGAVAELVACLLAYDMRDDGRVVPRSVYRGFETFDFGQKEAPGALRHRPPAQLPRAVRGPRRAGPRHRRRPARQPAHGPGGPRRARSAAGRVVHRLAGV